MWFCLGLGVLWALKFWNLCLLVGVVVCLASLFHDTQTSALSHSDLLGEVVVGENFTSYFSATGISKPIVGFIAYKPEELMEMK